MLIRLALAWMLGIVAADLFRPAPAWLWGTAGIGLLGLWYTWPRPQARALSAIALCALLGALRYSSALPVAGATSVTNLLEQGEVSLVGNVAGDPRRSEDRQQAVLQVEGLVDGDNLRPAEGQVLVVLPPFPAYNYGERLLVVGTLTRPRSAERPGEFDYRAYLAHRGIFSLISEPSTVRQLPGETGIAPLAALLRFRQHCRAVLLRTMPEPQAALGVGILLGIQASIPDEVYADFSTTGTSHILVVSGWNFTLVAAMLAALALRLRLGRGTTLIIALAVMWVYALFTGASAAVLRAAAMASLAAVGRASERQSEPWRLLLAGCWLISLADPHTLWDLGFQLSALATASLFAFAGPVEAQLDRMGWPTWSPLAPIREALTATLAAQVLTLPLILYQFGKLSLIAPLANIVLVPMVPYAMAAGTLVLVAGLIWLPLGQALGPLAWLPLAWLSEGAAIFARPRWAATQLPPVPLWALLVCYLVIGILWWRGQSNVAYPPE